MAGEQGSLLPKFTVSWGHSQPLWKLLAEPLPAGFATIAGTPFA